jgi:hypothetical protein
MQNATFLVAVAMQTFALTSSARLNRERLENKAFSTLHPTSVVRRS